MGLPAAPWRSPHSRLSPQAHARRLERLNFSPRVLLRASYGDRSKPRKEIHRHDYEPFPSSAERRAPWVFARGRIGSSDGYEALWRRRYRLADKPARSASIVAGSSGSTIVA